MTVYANFEARLLEQQMIEAEHDLFATVLDQELEEKELRKQKAIAACGSYRYNHSISLKTGREGHYYQFRCGHCPKCYTEAAKEDLFNFNAAILDHGSLKAGIVTKSEATRFIAALGKDNIKKYPQGFNDKGEPIYLVVTIFNYQMTKKVDEHVARVIQYQWQDWHKAPEIANFVEVVEKSREMEGYRESGKLDKLYTEEEKEQKATAEAEVEYFELVADDYQFVDKHGQNAPVAAVTHAWRLATAQTAKLDPQSPEEMQKCYNTRRNVYLAKLKSWGYKMANKSKRKILIGEHEIGWDLEYSEKISTIYSYFLTDEKKWLNLAILGQLKLPNQ